MTERPYSKATNVTRLEVELVAAGMVRGTRFFGVSTDGTTTTVYCADDLTGAEGATVDATVAAHVDVLLSDVQAARIAKMKREVKAYIYRKYDDGTQSSLNALFVEGVASGYANRVATIKTVLEWVKTVLTHYYTQKATILAMTTAQDAEAVTWNFTQFDATDPAVTLQQAVAITN